jgi:uncharacterized membrane protein YkoI
MQYSRECCFGFWLYDGLIKYGVKIEALNYDYWYELEKSDGSDVLDEDPVLNSDGETFMIVWMNVNMSKKISDSYAGAVSLEEAKKIALEISGSTITWI